MEWLRFLKFNLLGASCWVTVMVFAGYEFASEFDTLLGYIEKAGWAMAAGLFLLGYWVWRRQKRQFKAQRHPKAA
jgi:membrane protein DedA with SNARE-associated domain